MRPRCSSPEGAPAVTLASLPVSVAHQILLLLPVDCRLRCAEVCRAWRAVVAERSLWTHVDLSAASFEPRVLRPHVYLVNDPPTEYDALLRCVAARAAGGLQSLDARACTEGVHRGPHGPSALRVAARLAPGAA